MSDSNFSESPTTPSADTRRRGPTVVPGWMFLLLAVCVIAFYWLAPPEWGMSPQAGLFLYLAQWAAIGGLIGFALSRRPGRGPLLGALLGAALAALLMC